MYIKIIYEWRTFLLTLITVLIFCKLSLSLSLSLFLCFIQMLSFYVDNRKYELAWTFFVRLYQNSVQNADLYSAATKNPAKKNLVEWNRISRPFSMETLEDLFRRHHRYRPPSIVDGLRQPSIRGRLIPSASRAQPISHSLRAALHISQTCLQCRQSNANTALILELKLPSFANTELLPPRVLPILNHHPGARAFKLL